MNKGNWLGQKGKRVIILVPDAEQILDGVIVGNTAHTVKIKETDGRISKLDKEEIHVFRGSSPDNLNALKSTLSEKVEEVRIARKGLIGFVGTYGESGK
tara:strand:+ start:1259 stop:1555 length:297 start_codon:yes stop_codon:yes gene_type:complete